MNKPTLKERMKKMKEGKRNYSGVVVTAELEKKHSELMEYLGITTFSDLHRYAITKLYREVILNEKKVA